MTASGVNTMFNSFESTYWPFINNGGKVVKNALVIARNSIQELCVAFAKPIAGLGFLNAIATVINLKNLHGNFNDMFASIQFDKVKWAAWSIGRTISTAFDAADSFGSTWKALSVFEIAAEPAWYAASEFYLNMGMAAYGISRGVYDLHRMDKFKAKLQQPMTSNVKDVLTKAERKEKSTRRDIGSVALKMIADLNKRDKLDVVKFDAEIQEIVKEIDYRRRLTMVSIGLTGALSGAVITAKLLGAPAIIPVVALARSVALIAKHYFTM
jgi:hypothetical protein